MACRWQQEGDFPSPSQQCPRRRVWGELYLLRLLQRFPLISRHLRTGGDPRRCHRQRWNGGRNGEIVWRISPELAVPRAEEYSWRLRELQALRWKQCLKLTRLPCLFERDESPPCRWRRAWDRWHSLLPFSGRACRLLSLLCEAMLLLRCQVTAAAVAPLLFCCCCGSSSAVLLLLNGTSVVRLRLGGASAASLKCQSWWLFKLTIQIKKSIKIVVHYFKSTKFSAKIVKFVFFKPVIYCLKNI